MRQFEVVNGAKKRIPDLVLFVNGLPMVIMELKGSLAEQKLTEAFLQNETLKNDIPDL